MKTVGKILFILFKIAGVLATLLMLAVTIDFGWELSEFKKMTSPLIDYNGSIYQREDLIAMQTKHVTTTAGITAALFAVTLLMFIIGVILKKKKKAAQEEAA